MMRGGCWRAVLGLSGAQMLARPERPLSAGHAETFARLHRPARGARAGIAHPGRARVLWPHLRRLAGHARSAAGQRDADRGWPRTSSTRKGGASAAAHSRCRHRDRAACCSRCSPSFPTRSGVGTDTSQAALHVARDNARRLGVAASRDAGSQPMRSTASTGHSIFWFPIRPTSATSDIAGLDPEVRCFDPRAGARWRRRRSAFFRRTGAAIRGRGARWLGRCSRSGYDQADAVAALLASATGDRNRIS